MRVTVHLHTILQRKTPAGIQRKLELELAPGASLQELIEILEIELPLEALLLAVNGRIAEPDHRLVNDDEVRIMPALSGGGNGLPQAS